MSVVLLHCFGNSVPKFHSCNVSIDCSCRFCGRKMYTLLLSDKNKRWRGQVVCYALLCNMCELDCLPFLLAGNWYHAESNMGTCCFVGSLSCYWCLHLHGLRVFILWESLLPVIFFMFGSSTCRLFSYCCGDSCWAVISWKANCRWGSERWGFVYNLGIFFMAVLEALCFISKFIPHISTSAKSPIWLIWLIRLWVSSQTVIQV